MSFLSKIHSTYTIVSKKEPTEKPLLYIDYALDLGIPEDAITHIRKASVRYLKLTKGDRDFFEKTGYPLLMDWFHGEYMQQNSLPDKDIIRACKIVRSLDEEPQQKVAYRTVSLPMDALDENYKFSVGTKNITSWSLDKEGAEDFAAEMADLTTQDKIFLIIKIKVKPSLFLLDYIEFLTVQQTLVAMKVKIGKRDMIADMEHLWSLADQREILLWTPKGTSVDVSGVQFLKNRFLADIPKKDLDRLKQKILN